jgi:hypothetical protein
MHMLAMLLLGALLCWLPLLLLLGPLGALLLRCCWHLLLLFALVRLRLLLR